MMVLFPQLNGFIVYLIDMNIIIKPSQATFPKDFYWKTRSFVIIFITESDNL